MLITLCLVLLKMNYNKYKVVNNRDIWLIICHYIFTKLCKKWNYLFDGIAFNMQEILGCSVDFNQDFTIFILTKENWHIQM